jgi:hypothetical protein
VPQTLLLVTESGAHASHVLEQEFFDDPPRALERFTVTRADAYARPDLALQYGGPFPIVVIDGQVWRRPTAAAMERILAGAEPPSPTPTKDPLRYDEHNGGFGDLPRPPRAQLLHLLLDDEDARAQKTIAAIVVGGIHDQLAGGFHRDSTDAKWIVPHFEKRLSDQAALLGVLVRAGQPDAARGIVAYLERLRRGDAWAAVEDADIGPFDDASHWTWTMEEARAVLSPTEFAVAQPWWDLFGRGELHSDPTRNVLFRAIPPERLPANATGLLAAAREKLLAARDARVRPPVDETLYTAWNAALSRALLTAEEATRALAVLERLYAEALLPDGSVRHQLGGGIDDWLPAHGQLALAAREAHRVTGDPRHDEVARRITQRVTRDRARFSSQLGHTEDDELESPAALWAELTGDFDSIPAPHNDFACASLIRVARKHPRK